MSNYIWHRIRLRPRGPLTTPLRGDTLFGQLCWHVVELWGDERLEALLDGYTQGHPFMVVSDAFPQDRLPRPACPPHVIGLDMSDPAIQKRRKHYKALTWLNPAAVSQPVHTWHQQLAAIRAEGEDTGSPRPVRAMQPHNSLNRITGTTGEGFAPFSVTRTWFTSDTLMDLYVVRDDSRLSADELHQLFTWMGQTGFGKDASTGSGQFEVESLSEHSWPAPEHPNAWLTLAPAAIQGTGLVEDASYYSLFVRFGRHGQRHALSANPFKNPVLMADTAALLAPAQTTNQPFAGQGLGGNGLLSKTEPATVHQGYAPVIAVQLDAQGAQE